MTIETEHLTKAAPQLLKALDDLMGFVVVNGYLKGGSPRLTEAKTAYRAATGKAWVEWRKA
jgi:hypothetical protein